MWLTSKPALICLASYNILRNAFNELWSEDIQESGYSNNRVGSTSIDFTICMHHKPSRRVVLHTEEKTIHGSPINDL
jgi:hypothetical protein